MIHGMADCLVSKSNRLFGAWGVICGVGFHRVEI